MRLYNEARGLAGAHSGLTSADFGLPARVARLRQATGDTNALRPPTSTSPAGPRSTANACPSRSSRSEG
jgi:hypothetical protein